MNKQDIIIRPIRTEDIDGVQKFLLFQLKELFAQEGQLAITDDVWGLGKRYLEPANCNLWRVLTKVGEVVGTAAICTYNDRIELLKGWYHPLTTFWKKQGFKTIDEGGSAETVHMEKTI
ncbi:hypothetical protein [Desulfosporosinus shakirovi]|uniref:hypothetical protein n=1 Tax=Desulfosporosinus shakirovi TaxID=2885154 RepID=UPI001E44F6D1|nr:hypothetical protein [Desulfosporosinus sp. SRJS8]MCB8816082.1 hypothetical protein [Desulfosporosinus sp. SRJS8]